MGGDLGGAKVPLGAEHLGGGAGGGAGEADIPEQGGDGGREPQHVLPRPATGVGGSESGHSARGGVVQDYPAGGIDRHRPVIGRGEPGLEDPGIDHFRHPDSQN